MPTLIKRCLVLLCAGACLVGCEPGNGPGAADFQGVTMGTIYNIRLVDRPRGTSLDELRDGCDALLQAINQSLSTYLPESELSRFNASRSTAWQPVSAELAALVDSALALSRATDGAFDVTVGPLVNLWGFGPGAGADTVPDTDAVRAVLARVGYRNLQVRRSPPALKKSIPDLYVDLSAIAKGYAVDRLADYLERAGVSRYMVEIGGEVRTAGQSARGGAWRIAVEKPLTEGRVVHRIIELGDAGLATSGDYRNYFEHRGRRYSHTIDPASGRPVDHALASVTVVDVSAMRADALATALLVQGPQAGYAFAERSGLAALFITRTAEGFDDRATAALAPYLEATER